MLSIQKFDFKFTANFASITFLYTFEEVSEIYSGIFLKDSYNVSNLASAGKHIS